MPPHHYFYQDTISRRIANQGNPSPHEMRPYPAWHQPSISWSWGVIIIVIIIIIIIIIVIIIVVNRFYLTHPLYMVLC